MERLRAIFIDCPEHPECQVALGLHEIDQEELEKVRKINSFQWPALTDWLRQHPKLALAWVVHNPYEEPGARGEPKALEPEDILGRSPHWDPNTMTALDYRDRSKKKGRAIKPRRAK